MVHTAGMEDSPVDCAMSLRSKDGQSSGQGTALTADGGNFLSSEVQVLNAEGSSNNFQVTPLSLPCPPTRHQGPLQAPSWYVPEMRP